ncbi:MAG TPA: hypothetical protein VFG50_00845 [Rhodothermales bacterium]|nr:hypothetical protein [Rhodothermales bacterium]
MSTEHIFPTLPDNARLWIYVADRPLAPAEQQALRASLASFAQMWTSHGRKVVGEVEVLHDRFLVLGAVLEKGDISGCGIDSSVHAVEEAGRNLGVTWLQGLVVLFRDDQGAVQAVPRPAFRALVRSGIVNADTPVFDPGVATVGDLRQGLFERPAGTSWHARAFQIPTQLA